jgi:hypothetical protein
MLVHSRLNVYGVGVEVIDRFCLAGTWFSSLGWASFDLV